jgi:hypothetical protein
MHAVKLTIVALGVNEIQRGVVIAELLLTKAERRVSSQCGCDRLSAVPFEIPRSYANAMSG